MADCLRRLTALRHGSRAPRVMHACGHDGHMAMLPGAAERLAPPPDFAGIAVFAVQPEGHRPPMSFSEDFVHFSAALPGCFMRPGKGVEDAHGTPRHAAVHDFNDALPAIGLKLCSQPVRDRLPSKDRTDR